MKKKNRVLERQSKKERREERVRERKRQSQRERNREMIENTRREGGRGGVGCRRERGRK